MAVGLKNDIQHIFAILQSHLQDRSTKIGLQNGHPCNGSLKRTEVTRTG
jgi:hypothetical protein